MEAMERSDGTTAGSLMRAISMTSRWLYVVLFCVAAAVAVTASGRVGIYGIVEKVVFEPNDRAPERVQVWGAFAYADGATFAGSASEVRRGYLYFKLPGAGDPMLAAAKKEWADLKAVAGTGQAIGFGQWAYLGGFSQLDPSARSSGILEMYPGQRVEADLRVRPSTETPSAPVTYQTDSGMVKLDAQGSRSAIVKQLRQALQKP
jgi:hypothetical protein